MQKSLNYFKKGVIILRDNDIFLECTCGNKIGLKNNNNSKEKNFGLRAHGHDGRVAVKCQECGTEFKGVYLF